MEEAPIPICSVCFRTLKRYRTWMDWKGRPSHYACYKRVSKEAAAKFMYEDYLASQQ